METHKGNQYQSLRTKQVLEKLYTIQTWNWVKLITTNLILILFIFFPTEREKKNIKAFHIWERILSAFYSCKNKIEDISLCDNPV